MARYRKADNCGPVPYPDQSGRYLGEGEVVEDDEANDWSPLIALGFVVKTDAQATEDTKESPAELRKAVDLPLPPVSQTVSDMAKEADSGVVTSEESPQEEAPKEEAKKETKKKSRRKSRKKESEVSDGSTTANERGGAEEMDSAKTRGPSSEG